VPALKHDQTAAPESSAPILSSTVDWQVEVLRGAESIPAEIINAAVFDRLRRKFGADELTDARGFRSFRFAGNELGVPEPMEVVLSPHFLLVSFQFGYLRFGSETRVFLTRLDDYLAFPGHELRGLAATKTPNGFAFVVSPTFWRFLSNPAERNYESAFQDLLIAADAVGAREDLLWPLSHEEVLFQRLIETANLYGLPASADTITLDPAAAEFIGFRERPPHALEFREGNQFVRFSPTGIEWAETEEEHHLAAGSILSGWALDGEGRVCAICRVDPESINFAGLSLVRVLSEKELEAQRSCLNILAEL
jgi:hypothetical protein